ncbi:MAG: M24 family metallopeptidase [Bacteroidia bacterium]
MNTDRQTISERLHEAESKALILFEEAQKRNLICDGITELELNKGLLDLASEILGVKKFWHKRIVRSGANTLFPYKENPPNLLIQKDDILFFDFGPVLEDWEADIGRTYVIGDNPDKIKLRDDTVTCWDLGRRFIFDNPKSSGAEIYRHMQSLAIQHGWEFGGEHCGHLIGFFPHERIQGELVENYLHPQNDKKISEPDKNGNPRFWILEIHLVDRKKQIGGFYEGFVGSF